MSFIAHYDYNGMTGTVQMQKLPDGWSIRLEAQTPPLKYSHFVVTTSKAGSNIDVNPGAPVTFNVAEPQAMVYWRILARGEFMETYQLHMDFSKANPSLKLVRIKTHPGGVPPEHIVLHEYTFAAPEAASFKLYKSKGDMKVKKA